ncbi:MAG: pentose kinase [Planctomycetes bacterium GWF2_50_10]|nr:MAG: pentose kinase [Planctomycetes bacterium GWF2_50_10]
MDKYIIAYDLGTGGNKASLYNSKGKCLAASFVAYSTFYPKNGFHEQRPDDWWQAIVESTRHLLEHTNIPTEQITCCGISGHSLGVVPIDKHNRLMRDTVPIWSDSRSEPQQLEPFFTKIPESKWYTLTGNGFPAGLYSVFKILWLRDNEPEIYHKINKVIGTKDYINFKLTGKIATDYSYASGCGVYDLNNWKYNDELIAAAGIDPDILPRIVPSTEVLGHLTPDAAKEIGLPQTLQVVAGGVDNSCMALGARAFKEGRSYNSLGSSSWIAVCSSKPLLNQKSRPYVFAHVVPGMFASATAIFSAGSSFRWIKDQLCIDLVEKAQSQNKDVYDLMSDLARQSPVGAKGLLFNPSLAGGSLLDADPAIRGAFIGLDLGHSRNDLIRAAMEGISIGLRVALDELRTLTSLTDEMIAVGGASKSEVWRQIFADVYNMKIVKTSVDQQTAALGAAALAAVGTGIWSDFELIDQVNKIESVVKPNTQANNTYNKIIPIFQKASGYLADLGKDISHILYFSDTVQNV